MTSDLIKIFSFDWIFGSKFIISFFENYFVIFPIQNIFIQEEESRLQFEISMLMEKLEEQQLVMPNLGGAVSR